MSAGIAAFGVASAAQAQQARGGRRIGLGLTGLADTLIMLGLHYGSAEARQLARQVLADPGAAACVSSSLEP